MYIGKHPQLFNKVGTVIINVETLPMVIFVCEECEEKEYRVKIESLSFLTIPETELLTME